MKKSLNIFIAASALALCLPAMSCSKSDRKAAADPAMTVTVATPVVDSVVLTKTYPGYLYTNQTVNLVARINGYLTSKPYKGGTYVRKGQVLFTIESQPYIDAVNRAKADLETSKANNVYAQRQYEAVKKALESNAVSKMEVEQARSNYEQSLAAISSAKASLQSAETTLSYCTVRAPFDGLVSDPTADVGTYLAGAGSPVTLATIYDDSKMTAVFSIEDARYASIVTDRHNGLGADYTRMPIRFSDKMSHGYTADLSYTAPAVDTSTGTLTVKAGVENPDHELKAGMYFTIDLPYAVDPNAILVQDAAISSDQRGKYLYTVTDSSTIAYTPVEVGQLVADTMRVVKSGLRPGDRYVTSALLKVRPGMRVKAVEQ